MSPKRCVPLIHRRFPYLQTAFFHVLLLKPEKRIVLWVSLFRGNVACHSRLFELLKLVITLTKYQLLTPKTKDSVRTIKIDEMQLNMLKKHRIKQNEIKLKNRLVYKDNGFIFAPEDGHPQLRKVVDTRLKRLLKKAGILKNKTPHSFRHTPTSLLIDAGAGIKKNPTMLRTFRIQISKKRPPTVNCERPSTLKIFTC